MVTKTSLRHYTRYMIIITQLSGREYYINPHQIESIDSKPDTTIVMLSGKKIVVKEKPQEVLERIIAYRKQIGGFKNEL
ncbi:MAG: flagellar FlbD family protein [Termitinemataceae bacterium]|nr:MAG: flagellar FlbD family protein [Termitinemataceae bacterium]